MATSLLSKVCDRPAQSKREPLPRLGGGIAVRVGNPAVLEKGGRKVYISLLRDEVLVRIEKPERMTASKLLWIPETAKRPDEEVYNGIVLATGPGARSNRTGAVTPCDVKVGDRVFLYWYGVEGASKCRWPDAEHIIVSEDQIRGVYE